MNEVNETVEVVGGFDKAVDAMKKLQRAYTTVRLDTELSSQSLDAIKTLRDMVEELVVGAYGPIPSPFKPGVVYGGGMKPGEVYLVEPSAIPPGFILIDETQLREQMIAPAFDDRTRQIIEIRIRELFKKPK